MRKKLYFLLIITLLALFSACDSKRVFDEYQPIPDGNWHKDSILVFDVPITDTLQNHNLYFNIRNHTDYSYSNIWLFITIEQPKGNTLNDTFEITLANPSGKWLGEGFGGHKTVRAMYRNNVFFPNSGSYTISIQQGMRENILQGISDVGLRIEKMN